MAAADTDSALLQAAPKTDGLPNPKDERVAISTTVQFLLATSQNGTICGYLENCIKYIRKFRWRLDLVII